MHSNASCRHGFGGGGGGDGGGLYMYELVCVRVTDFFPIAIPLDILGCDSNHITTNHPLIELCFISSVHPETVFPSFYTDPK